MSESPELTKEKEKNQRPPHESRGERPKAEPTEKYYRVKFQAKSHPNDSEDVMLAVNGETLIIQREKEVIIPQRFLECADHTVYPTFKQMPGQPRKEIGKVKLFPYDRLGEATEGEYLNQKREGTRATKETIKKHGFDYMTAEE